MILDLDAIRQIDLTELGELITNDQYRDYFLLPAGEEHYTLLAYISTQFNNSVLIDVGTNRGSSALALGYNKTNKVHSFDLYELKELSSWPDNIQFYLDDITCGKYDDLIMSSPFIMLDTDHDGTFEQHFHEHLRKLKYEGYLLLDDINVNDPMRQYWNSITEEKFDITNMGHWSGTGLVIFS